VKLISECYGGNKVKKKKTIQKREYVCTDKEIHKALGIHENEEIMDISYDFNKKRWVMDTEEEELK